MKLAKPKNVFFKSEAERMEKLKEDWQVDFHLERLHEKTNHMPASFSHYSMRTTQSLIIPWGKPKQVRSQHSASIVIPFKVIGGGHYPEVVHERIWLPLGNSSKKAIGGLLNEDMQHISEADLQAREQEILDALSNLDYMYAVDLRYPASGIEMRIYHYQERIEKPKFKNS